MKNLLVTCALPYANGPIHLGHLVEYIQADIWVRFQRLQGRDCLFICGEDTHGTPVMLAAQKQQISPEQLIASIKEAHERDLAGFHISFDHYYTTHSPENKVLTEFIYQRMFENKAICVRTIAQAYDPQANMFLPDRYVKGCCPCCKTPEQYGDNCEACGSTYAPLDLINPISVVSGCTPIAKESEHYFFKLSQYTEFLRAWIQAGHVQEEVKNKLLEWFKEGLHDLDISRDAPYFGFTIPGRLDKYFYVWLDAPIGYIAIFQHLCAQRPELDFSAYWHDAQKTDLYHFIGKDIINFHAIFWPAILKSAGFRTPTQIITHGYLTIDGQKMSKSRGTFILARSYLEHFHPDYLRYYFASKLNHKADDLDLNFDEFMQRINAELISKLINIASRCARFINQEFNNQLAHTCAEPELLQTIINAHTTIAEYYQHCHYHRIIRTVMNLTEKVNQYIDRVKPWTCIKDPNRRQETQIICTTALNCFRILMLYLKPILPNTVAKVETFLNSPELNWQDHKNLLLTHNIRDYEPLLTRITDTMLSQFKTSIQKA